MYLGLDLGTSGLRALLVDGGGHPVAEAEAACSVSHPHPGWSEQNPDEWIAAARTALDTLHQNAPEALSALRGIGLAGQMHGATLLGTDDRPLRPCILWNDTRSHAEAATFDADPRFRAITGTIVFPGFTAPKLAWVAAHEPEIFAATARVLLPKDYLRLWLTGEAVSEMSDSAGTAWLDVAARDWSTALIDASGMRPDQMPRLVEGSAEAGRLRADLAADWGISGPVVVAGGAGDNAAAACGTGALVEGAGFVSLGTSGVILAARDGFAPLADSAVHTFCHAIPGTWYQMSVTLAATDSLNWLAKLTGRSAGELALAVEGPLGPPGPVAFLPYLSGERTPHNDSAVRATLTGLDITHGPDALTRAVMEGVAFSLRDGLDALRAAGARPERLLTIGGGARSAYWSTLLATILNLPLDRPAKGEFGAALGAARLAICATTGAAPSDVMTAPAIAETLEPDATLTDAYAEAHARFRALYPAVTQALGQT